MAKKNGVLSCWVDLNEKKMSFGYDGKVIGTPFSNFDIGPGLYPAFSANSGGEELCFNFGDTSFVHHPPPNYLPVSAALQSSDPKN